MATAKTYVYFNLHKHVWSVMLRGLVKRHATFVVVKNADFVVRAAGHRKVLEQKRKNVHAFVRGEDVSDLWSESGVLNYEEYAGHGTQLSYNPYRGAHFYRKDTGEVVESATLVVLRDDKTVWAWGVK